MLKNKKQVHIKHPARKLKINIQAHCGKIAEH